MSRAQREPNRVISEGEAAYTRWRTDLVKEEPNTKRCKISRRMNIPGGYDYIGLLIGARGSRVKALETEVGGQVKIRIRDGKDPKHWYTINEIPHVLLEGEASCVDKAERLINDMWNFKTVKREIRIPVELNPEYDYVGLLLGSNRSRIKELMAEAGGKLTIKLRGKGVDNAYDSNLSDKPPHVLLEGDPSCVDRAETLINNVWNFEIISRKIVIPEGCDYFSLLVGSGGSKARALQVEAGGNVTIEVRGKNRHGKYYSNEPMHVFLQGEFSCVSKTESFVMDLLKISERERTRAENMRDFSEPHVANVNANYYGRSVLDRVDALANDAGLKFHSDETLISKVMRLENEIFSKVKSGTIKERISCLEKEMG